MKVLKSSFAFLFGVFFVRMSPKLVDHLLTLVQPLIKKKDINLRKSISAKERLTLIFAFLSKRRLTKVFLEKQQSETCEAIYLG